MANPNGNPNWTKGQSANPKGRPKGTGHPTFRGLIEKLKEEHPNMVEWQHPDFGESLSDPFCMASIQTIAAAQNGEPWAIKEILDRGFGKAHQSLAVEHDGSQHLEISFGGKRDEQPEEDGENGDDDEENEDVATDS